MRGAPTFVKAKERCFDDEKRKKSKLRPGRRKEEGEASAWRKGKDALPD